MRPEEWIVSGEVGLSSECIWSVMMGVQSHGDYPLDPSDFRRCKLLLDKFPEWKKRLPEVSSKFPKWKGLIENWDDLEKLYLKEFPSGKAPMLYARMKELLTPQPTSERSEDVLLKLADEVEMLREALENWANYASHEFDYGPPPITFDQLDIWTRQVLTKPTPLDEILNKQNKGEKNENET